MSRRFSLSHIPALDGLRGLAVAVVLLFHAGHLDGGYLGVDLFFVLSGFLITTLLLIEWDDSDRIDLRHFWARRARRLLPALLLVVGFVAVYSVLAAEPIELDRIRYDAIATAGYVANWRTIFAGLGYWDLFTAPSPLEHTWSLAIEEQFYLVWPIVVLAVLRWVGKRQRSEDAPAGGFLTAAHSRTIALLSIVGAIGFGVLALLLFEPGTDPTRVYLGTDTRAPAVLMGAALAAVLQWLGPARSTRARATVEVIGCLAMAGLLFAWSRLPGDDPLLYRGGLLACGLAAVAVLASATHPRVGPLARVLSVSPLRWTGLISYGLYLWHWPVFVWVRRTWGGPEKLGGWSLTAVQLSVSVALAVASYHFVEQPIRKRGLAALPRPALAPIAAVVVIGSVLVATTGARHEPTIEELAAVDIESAPTLPPLPTIPSTTGAGTNPTAPTATSATASVPPRIMVVGDSVAQSLGDELVVREGEWGVQSANRGYFGCGIARSSRARQVDGSIIETHSFCLDWPDRWRSDLAAFDPDVVFLMVGAPPMAEVEMPDGEFRPPCDAAFDEWYVDEVRNAIDVASSTGAIVAVSTVPNARFSFAPDWVDERVDCLNESYAAAVASRPDTSTLVDLAGWTCPGGKCREVVDGVKLREDGLHFRGPGAFIALEWLVPEMIEAMGG